MQVQYAESYGRQHALLTLGLIKNAYDLSTLNEQWPGITPEKMQEMVRARALAPQSAEAARYTQEHNAARIRANLGPVVSRPASGLGWQPGHQNPVSIRGAKPDLNIMRQSGGGIDWPIKPTPLPVPLESFAPYRANIPAAPPSAEIGHLAHVESTQPDVFNKTLAGPRALPPAASTLEHTGAGSGSALRRFGRGALKVVAHR